MSASRLSGIGALAFIACFALLPQPWKGRMATFGVMHDCAHYAAFLAACLLTTWRVRSIGVAARTAVMILSFGILLEFAQTRVYGNRFEYLDVVADAGGVATGVLLRNLRNEWRGE